jgi:beta-phosphoglucomutase-like phosphatase (HAD superfamily)
MLRTSAVIFDFDGVIADSEPLHFRAYREVVASEGVDLSERQYYDRYLGFDDVGSFEAIARDVGIVWDGAKIRDLIERKAELMEALERDVSVLFPGAGAVVRRTASAVPIAIASGALGHEIRRVLDREGLTRYFSVIVAAEDTPVSKPAPDPYLCAVSRLSSSTGFPIEPSNCLALEDSIQGLQSARRAGLRTVGVAHTYPRKSLISHADMVISTIGEFDFSASG